MTRTLHFEHNHIIRYFLFLAENDYVTPGTQNHIPISKILLHLVIDLSLTLSVVLTVNVNTFSTATNTEKRHSALLKQCQACTASTCLVSSFTEFLNPVERSKSVLIYHSSFRLGKQQLLLWIKKLSNTQTTHCTGLGVVISIQHSLASFISRGRNYLFIFISV